MTRIPTAPFRRRTFTAAVAGIATAFGLAACGGGQSAEEAAGGGGGEGGEQAEAFNCQYDGPQVNLSYWNGFTGGDGPFMQQLVDQFNTEHENINVESNTVAWADFYQRVPAASQAGEGPDVGVMHLDQLATHAARNIIIPIDDVAEGAGLTQEDFSEEIWNAGLYQDQRYGLPLDVHPLAMYYNTEHFEAAGISEPPTDEESFRQALEALQAAGHEMPFWMPTLWPAHLIWFTLDWQNGGQPYAEDGSEALFDTEEGVNALEWQRSMVEEGFSPSDVAIDAQQVAFKNGETSITFDGIWMYKDFEAAGVPMEMVPVPVIGEEDAVWANSHHFFVTSQAEEDPNKLEASKVFLCWMMENSGEWAQSGMIPARESLREESLEGMPQQVIAEKIDAMRFVPAVPGIGGVTTETLEPAVASGVLGAKPPEQALTEADTRATELMQRNLQQFGG